MKTRVLVVAAVLASACESPAPSSAPDSGAGEPDAGGSLDAGVLADAGEPLDAGRVIDAGDTTDAGDVADAGTPADAGAPIDAGSTFDPGHNGWAQYTLLPGAHYATVQQNGAARLPLAGLATASARTFQFIFDASAMYVLTNPAQPDDQLDWNKLPGLSDCGELDLSVDGLMFGWRWRPDLTPPLLEIAHYANNGGTHLYPSTPLFTLDESELRAETPLRYELTITSTEYQFHVSGTVGARTINVSATFPRRCSGATTSSLKWAAGFYFGGTSTAPQRITGWAQE